MANKTDSRFEIDCRIIIRYVEECVNRNSLIVYMISGSNYEMHLKEKVIGSCAVFFFEVTA